MKGKKSFKIIGGLKIVLKDSVSLLIQIKTEDQQIFWLAFSVLKKMYSSEGMENIWKDIDVDIPIPKEYW